MKMKDLKNLPALPEGRVYFCVAPGCWGKGDTPDKAIKNARMNHSRTYFGEWWALRLYDAPADTFLDGLGYSHSRSIDKATLVFEREARKK